jgi:hypothetical protein
LLRRLQEDPRAEGALLKIVEAAGEEIHAGHYFPFIGFVLSAKYEAECADGHNREMPLLKRKIDSLNKAFRRKTKKASSLEDFERVAQHMRNLRKIETPASSPDPMLTIRSDRDGSRQRVIFMRELSAAVHDVAGLWLDEAVADLTDVAFPGTETTADAVRSARCPSTRKGRL